MAASSHAPPFAGCAFCGTPRPRAGRLVEGPGIAICEACLRACREILSESSAGRGSAGRRVPSPAAIKRQLDLWVVGQEQAKRRLAVAVHSHYAGARHRQSAGASDVEIDKANVLLIGPTGTGKTLLARVLARTIDVPIHFGDATALTEAGYVGEDVESLIEGLLDAAGQDVERCQRGIVFLDEVDKLARRAVFSGNGRDVGGEGVQHALLKLLEGRRVPIRPRRGRRQSQEVVVDTSGILFILGGAFVGLDAITGRRLGRRSVGFCAGPPLSDRSPSSADVANDGPGLPVPEPQDLVTYGMVPEFVGRIAAVAALHPLDEAALVRILGVARGSLVRQYKRLFRMDGISLEFTDDALHAIAREARLRGLGARGLRQVMEEVLLPLMFDLPSRTDVRRVLLTAGAVTGEAQPELLLHSRTG